MNISVEPRGGDEYAVRVGDRTEHSVRAPEGDLARVARPGERAEDTIARAFRFLLDREGPESILRSFALADIARYFPEFWEEMRSS